jgi:hypothetical protein
MRAKNAASRAATHRFSFSADRFSAYISRVPESDGRWRRRRCAALDSFRLLKADRI